MSDKTIHFVYLTTNLLDGKQYIGDHSTDNLDCYKTKNYFGSGRPYLVRALRLYEKKNFKREILEFFPTKEEAFNAQKGYIEKFNTLFPNGYNLSPTGGLGVKNCFISNKKMSEEHKDKIRKKLEGRNLSSEHIENLKGKNIGKKLGPLSQGHKESIGKIWKGKKQSSKHIEKRVASYIKTISKKHA